MRFCSGRAGELTCNERIKLLISCFAPSSATFFGLWRNVKKHNSVYRDVVSLCENWPELKEVGFDSSPVIPTNKAFLNGL